MRRRSIIRTHAMKKFIASLALLAVLCGLVVPAFADEAAAPAAASTAAPVPAAVAPTADAAAATPKCGDKGFDCNKGDVAWMMTSTAFVLRSEEHTSELQSPCNLVCR